MPFGVALASLAGLSLVRAQQAGTLTPETHPALTIQQCAQGGSCTTLERAVVLDANWRWVHSVSGSTNCYTGNQWNTQLCPDPVTCAANCALDGANYAGTYGITTSGNSITLDFVTGSNVGSRVYLLETDTTYQEFNLLNQEFTFDVDVSTLPCGLNGALYFSQMFADGGTSEYSGNKAGAAYGTGYCDAQCPQDVKFINGEANVDDWTPSSNNANTGTGEFGSCCNEMDIWEANSISNAYTPHVCSVNKQTLCTGTDCGAGTQRYNGICDKDGCDWNPYRWGDTSFYGPGKTVDTSSKFSVVTQFITNDGTNTGTLTEIRRFYVQNGKLIANPRSTLNTLTSYNSVTDAFCNAQKTLTGDTNSFESKGGLATLGKAFSSSGMVLVMSLWDDYAADMLWLDSDYPTNESATSPGVARGTCATSSGVPSQVESQSPNAKVTWSNIKYGALNSTWSV